MSKTCKCHVKISILSIIACSIVLPAITLADDWPNYRGLNHDGFTAETDWNANWGPDGPKVLWKASVGMGFSSVTISRGRAYTMGNTGQKGRRIEEKDIIFCFDAETGKELWRRTYPCPLEPKYYEGGTLSTPTAEEDRLYTLSKMGDLYCLNANTGEVIWLRRMNKDLGYEFPKWHFATSPLIQGDMLILNLGKAGVALDKKTGDILWQNGKDECGYATPVLYTNENQQHLAIFGADHLYGVKLQDGKILWSYPFENKATVNAADPIVMDGNLFFITSGYNRGCALIRVEANKAEKVWDNKVMRSHMSSPMLWNGYIYGFDESTLKCIDPKDGSEKWAENSLGKGSFSMCTDGRMILLSEQGELVIAKADPESFKPIARAQILPRVRCWVMPVLSNGKIYARNVNGDLVCVDVKE